MHDSREGTQARCGALRLQAGIRADWPVDGVEEFNFSAVGAMREYATKQPGRKFPACDEVLKLAAKARESLAGQP
jgi:hypothetical protein